VYNPIPAFSGLSARWRETARQRAFWTVLPETSRIGPPLFPFNQTKTWSPALAPQTSSQSPNCSRKAATSAFRRAAFETVVRRRWRSKCPASMKSARASCSNAAVPVSPIACVVTKAEPFANPNYRTAALYIAISYAYLGDVEKSRDWYRQLYAVIEKDPDPARKIAADTAYASALRASGHENEARRVEVQDGLRNGRSGESGLAVNLAERNRYTDGVDFQFFVQTLVVAQRPPVIRLTGVLLDANLVLVNQDIVLEGSDGPIMLKFQAPVVMLGGTRENLEDGSGIMKGILAGFWLFSANHGQIRIGVHFAGDPDAEIGVVHSALGAA